MRWSSRKKKDGVFCNIHFVRRNFFWHLCFTSMYYIVHKINFQNIYIYIHLDIKKHYFIQFCCLFLKSSKTFSVSLTWINFLLKKHEMMNFDWTDTIKVIMLPSKWGNLSLCSAKLIHVYKKLLLAFDYRQSKYSL